MGTFTPAISGLGADSYTRIQKESAFGTALTNAMTFIPITGGQIKKVVADIENKTLLASRLKQTPNAGKISIGGELEMLLAPAHIGAIMQLLLGTSTDAGTADAGYTHTWLMPVTGVNVGNSFTLQQALGANLADQFDGMIIAGITLSSDAEGNQKIKLDCVGQGHTAGVARQTTFTYSSLVPFSFGMTNLAVLPEAGLSIDSFALAIKSYELKIDLGLDKEQFYLGNGGEISRPTFKTIPTISFKCTVDADSNFIHWARDKHYAKLTLSTVHTSEQAGAVSGNYSVFAEIPKAKLAPDTAIKEGYDRLDLELNWDCGFGGVTTGSGTTPVMAEVRVLDNVSAYA